MWLVCKYTPKEFANCSPGFLSWVPQRKVRANAEGVGEPRSRSWPTLSAFAGSVDGLSQGVATLYPGLALVNAFGVPVLCKAVHGFMGLCTKSLISLCNLCVLCVSVVVVSNKFLNHRGTEDTEVAQRRSRKRTFRARPVHGHDVRRKKVISALPQTLLSFSPGLKPGGKHTL